MLRDRLLAAKRRSGLDAATLEALAHLAEGSVQAWERGDSEPDVDEADRAARVFGARVEDLDTAGGWPLEAFLFRSTGSTGLLALHETGTFATFGELLRVAADIGELERVLEEPRAALPFVEPNGTPAFRAQQARHALGIGPAEPIPCMRGVVEHAGIRVLFETDACMHPSFEGASAIAPRPVILVNHDPGTRAGWARIRMVIAHELAHLLFDHEGPSVSAPSLAKVMRFSEPYADLEQLADAFAANLLAPDAGVRAAVAGRHPASGEAVRVVGQTFGVGKQVAVNRLRDVYQLPKHTRVQMLARPVAWDADFAEDVPSEDEIGLRSGTLANLVLRAVKAKRLDRVRARRMLELRLSDPLPPGAGLVESERAPLRAAHLM